MPLTTCPDCNNQISDSAESCPHCGRPMVTSIKCPTCKSTNVQKISTGSKLGSALMWGVLAANKLKSTYQCKDCKYKW
jgi:transposase-like protein